MVGDTALSRPTRRFDLNMPSIAIMIKSPALSNNAANALAFCQAVLEEKKAIALIFFYGEGVHLASKLAVDIQGDTPIVGNWQRFIQTHQLTAEVCITSGLKRGVLDSEESNRYNKSASSIADGIELGGLGSWASAVQTADQHIVFN